MARRNFLVITAEILDACKNGAKRTHVLYGVNLSFHQMNKYMTLLERRKLIRYDSKSRMYWTVEEGLNFLAEYWELEEASKKYADKRKRLLGMLNGNK